MFIVFEGGEGTGKSTLIEMVKKLMESSYNKVMVTREPGGVLTAEKIREVIIDKNHTMMDSYTEALLYAAARREHLVHKVKPSLSKGEVVLCDRFVGSSLVYQGIARGLGMNVVAKINEPVIGDCMPDLVIILDLDPVEGLSRINQDPNREKNRLDLENLDFHLKVREGYKSLLDYYPDNHVLVDASGTPEEVLKKVWDVISNYNFKR